jgi:hypothetical protein
MVDGALLGLWQSALSSGAAGGRATGRHSLRTDQIAVKCEVCRLRFIHREMYFRPPPRLSSGIAPKDFAINQTALGARKEEGKVTVFLILEALFSLLRDLFPVAMSCCVNISK